MYYFHKEFIKRRKPLSHANYFFKEKNIFKSRTSWTKYLTRRHLKKKKNLRTMSGDRQEKSGELEKGYFENFFNENQKVHVYVLKFSVLGRLYIKTQPSHFFLFL